MKLLARMGEHADYYRMGAAVFAAVLLVVLFVFTQPISQRRHNAMLSYFGQLQNDEANLGKSVLELNFGLSNNYDHVNAIYDHMQEVVRLLEENQAASGLKYDTKFRQNLQMLEQRLSIQSDVLEQFKSSNAVLKNSLIYLPNARDNLERELPPGSMLRKLLDDLVEKTLLVRIRGGSADINDFNAAISNVQKDSAQLSIHLQHEADQLLNHIRNIDQLTMEMPKLIRQLSISLDVEDVAEAYQDYYDKQQQRSAAYRIFLLLATLALLAYAIKIVIRLRKQTRQLKLAASVFATTSDGIVITDTNAKILEVNPVFMAVTGYTREEILGKNPRMLQSGRQDQQFYSNMWKSIIDSGQWQGEIWNRRKGGEEYPEWLTITTVKDKDGVITNYVGVFRDIAERKQAEDALRESVLFQNSLLNAIPIPVFYKDKDGRYLGFNNAYESFFGATRDQLIGKTVFDISPQKLAEIYFSKDAELFKCGGIQQYESQVKNTCGELRDVIFSKAVFADSRGEIGGLIGAILDITDRKMAENEIKHLAFYDPLTHLPNRRLLNDRLGQAMATSRRSGHYGALMFLDLDNFKPLNDKYGHDVGDLLLVEVACRISRCVREVDTVARFGGDEFVVMLSELEAEKSESIAQAEIIAEKIRATLADTYVLTVYQNGNVKDTVEYHCTSSIGVVVFLNHEANSEDIIRWADMAMYQAKEDGRDLVRFFDLQSGDDAGKSEQGAILRLKWHESYNSGEPTIDQEHRKIFDLANKLIEFAFARNGNPQGFDSAMKELLAHVVHHFADEEEILARHHYVDLDAHARAHKVLIEHALKLCDSAAGVITISELVNFLAHEVVVQHMLKMDHEFYSLFTEVQ